jgi:tRNA pseudouridine38-40 synthase
VRNIVGTLVEVGRGKRYPEEMQKIIDSCDRNIAGITAPARGLHLKEVKY